MKDLVTTQYVIAIGASAGGFDALLSFFKHTPVDGVSYVIVQYLSADHKSRIAERLSHSKLAISEVSNDMKVEANKIYFLPKDKCMTIMDGRLQLTDNDQESCLMAINTFFISLAAEHGDKAIGIILSGTGKDGALGIEAIQKAGGMVIVQDPATAKYGGMPAFAISTGYTDSVLAPEAMPQAIEHYVKEDLREFSLVYKEGDENALLDILNLIKSQVPLDFSHYRRPTILRRIKRRMEHNNFSSTDKYFSFLQNSPEEVSLLANDFLISVTSFFRDQQAFAYIEKDVIPELVQHLAPGDSLKIWVAGCATGEEAYSLAILVYEHMLKANRHEEVKIFATDINKAALDHASKGIYPESIVRDVSKERLEQFFTKEGERFRVKPEIRKMLIFAQHDLTRNPPYSNIDLISCRNLLIYMNSVLQRKILSMLHFGLKQGGYLFLGLNENSTLLKPYFVEVNKALKVFKSEKTVQPKRFEAFIAPVIDNLNTLELPHQKTPFGPSEKAGLTDVINELILSECGYAGVCVDEELKVVGSFGDLAPYLRQKIFTFRLNELLPEQLSVALGAAVHRAVKRNKRVALKRIKVKNNRTTIFVDLLVRPFFWNKSAQKLMLILFKENEHEHKEDELFNEIIHTQEYITGLEEDLKNTAERLERIQERVESSSEIMQSFNEELLSANEEMQSSNDEMQSANAALQTINKEHQLRIRALTALNEELNNYFISNINGQLWIDRNLLLKKFSPAATELINIQEIDIGRPITHITTNIKEDTLVEDIKKVVQAGVVIRKEVQSVEEKWYQVMIMPYTKQGQSVPDGIIITFCDVTTLKRKQEELASSNEGLLRINADLDNFVLTAAHDLMGPIVNIESLLAITKSKTDKTDPEAEKINKLLDSAVVNFKGVLKGLTDVGKIEAEMKEKSVVIFDKILEDIQLSMFDKINATKAIIKTDLREKKIKFSEKNLRSILYNLINNAIKYKSPERDPEITISTKAISGFIKLSVRDNGIGIEDSKIKSIFNLYGRLAHGVEGQGIGLFLVRKIINAAGGKVEVESELDKGSVFTIYFKV